ncbi:MAG: 50S ribosomal protein L25/general stress protein Ctc [Candidatus Berkiella sp.]
MTGTFELEVEPRTVEGKGASRRLRRLEKKVPAIIYGNDLESTNIMLEHRIVTKALENEAFYSHVLTLIEGKTKHKVVLKDVQRHPYKPIIMHLDFMRINDKKAITMHVPLHFLGEDVAPGVKQGGMITHHMVEVEVRCLPKDLPEFLEVDLSNAQMDQIIHLNDIKLPKNVELMALVHNPDADQTVASIHKPRAAVEEDATVAEDATKAEGDKAE